jgi:hypothetical protein
MQGSGVNVVLSYSIAALVLDLVADVLSESVRYVFAPSS